jgi:hypothetical protein
MKRFGLSITILLVVAVVNLSILHLDVHRHDGVRQSHVISQDTAGPTIEDWNVTDPAYRGQEFDVWAVVFDDDSGVQNVSLQVRNSVATTNWYIMSYNGTHYTESIPALPVNETYTLRLYAFDLANNSRNSYVKNIDLRITGPLYDPNITLPFVVSGSLGMFLLVVIVAYFYDKRQGRSISRLVPPELESDADI